MSDLPTTPIERDPAKLADALPWYLNGTLSDDDRAWVDAQLAADPTARDLLAFDRRIGDELEAMLARTPADIGWQQLLTRVRTDGVAQRGASPARPARLLGSGAGSGAGGGSGSAGGRGGAGGDGGGMMSRLLGLFNRVLTPQLGMAMAALLVVQAVAIGVLIGDGTGEGDTVEYRSGAGVEPVETIRALLNQNATEQRLRDALLANQAVIIDGPNALGEYWILAPGRPAGTVAAALRDAGVIASFTIDHRPRVR